MPKPYLIQRPSGLYARFLVPADLRAAIGSRFIVRRLPAASPDLARLAAARLAVALCNAFERMRDGRMVDRDKARRELADTIKEWSGNITLPDGTTLTNVQTNGPEDNADLLAFVNGLGAGGGVKHAPAAGPLLSDRIAAYKEDLTNAKVSAGNLLDTANTLGIFLELTSDRPLRFVSDKEVRAFLGALSEWPSNARKKKAFAGMDAPAIIKEAKRLRAAGTTLPGLSDRAIGKHRDRLASFFNAQVASRHLDSTPMAGIKRQSNTDTKKQTRRAFTREEVLRLFDPATFLPWSKDKPHRYWGVLLGATTGARVNEVAQLYRSDVEQINGIWGIHIRALHRDQKLKNANSLRFVPLHPGVVAAGFLTYLADTEAAKHARVFPHLPWHAKSGYGDQLSDQFGAYLASLGMTEEGLGFHCFRHSVSTLLAFAAVPVPTAAAISGHLSRMPGSMADYVDAPTLPDRAKAIKLLSMPPGLPPYKSGDAAQALQVAHAKAKRREVNRAARKRREQARPAKP